MNWTELNDISQLTKINEESKTNPVMILKHSTRCSISSAALGRIERKWNPDSKIKTYLLDLLAHRDISNAIAEHYKTEHQSPQILLITDGKCTFSRTHFEINAEEILAYK